MDKTAEQIYNDFNGKLVKIKKTNGEKIIGYILLSAGLEKARNLVPGTSFLQVDAISNIEVFKKDPQKIEHELIIIHPDDIDNIREYDLSNMTIQMSYSAFQDIISGASPLYMFEMINEMEDGKTYVVIHEGAKYKVVYKNDQLALEPIL